MRHHINSKYDETGWLSQHARKKYCQPKPGGGNNVSVKTDVPLLLA